MNRGKALFCVLHDKVPPGLKRHAMTCAESAVFQVPPDYVVLIVPLVRQNLRVGSSHKRGFSCTGKPDNKKGIAFDHDRKEGKGSSFRRIRRKGRQGWRTLGRTE